MKIKLFIVAIVYALGLVYLTLPSPTYPDLDQAVRSDEPGDTYQHPDQKGFYTNLGRAEVIKDIQSKYVLKFFGYTIPSYRLNYRPEEAFSLVRDQMKSNYLEEIVYPFRESLFVNGWEPINAPIYANTPAIEIPEISIHGVPYMSKVSLKPTNSNVFVRVAIWTLLFPVSYLVFISLKKALKNDKN